MNPKGMLYSLVGYSQGEGVRPLRLLKFLISKRFDELQLAFLYEIRFTIL